MKLKLVLIIVICLTSSFGAVAQIDQRPLDLPRISQRAVTLQKIGITTIEVDYSRPQVILNGQDRTGNIWGNRAHYGLMPINFACNCEIPWRAGADENTVITFSQDVKIEGKELKKGRYGLHMIIEESGLVTVIFSNNSTSWGSFYYSEEEDALRVTVHSREIEFSNLLTYSFDEVGVDFGVLSLKWEHKEIPINIEVDVHEHVVQGFRKKLKGYSGFMWRTLFDAANYCANNQINQTEAIGWVDRAILTRPEFFAQYSIKLGLHFQLDEHKEGLSALDQGIQFANINEINGIGYYLLRENFNEKAVELFRLNVEKNPEVANVYDSLGEGLRALGKNEEAIQNFKKVLSLSPPELVKNNSIRNLEELGVTIDEN